MTEQEIKDSAPSGATHYYLRCGFVYYLKYYFHNKYELYYDGDWLMRKLPLEFRFMLKPL